MTINRYGVKEEEKIIVPEETNENIEDYDKEEYEIAIAFAKLCQSNGKKLSSKSWIDLCNELQYYLGHTVHINKVKIFSTTYQRFQYLFSTQVNSELKNKTRTILPLTKLQKKLRKRAVIDVDTATKDILDNVEEILDKHRKAKLGDTEEHTGNAFELNGPGNLNVEKKHHDIKQESIATAPKFQTQVSHILKGNKFQVAILLEEWFTRIKRENPNRISSISYEKLESVFCQLLGVTRMYNLVVTKKTLSILKDKNKDLYEKLKNQTIIDGFLSKEHEAAKKFELQVEKLVIKNNPNIGLVNMRHLLTFFTNELGNSKIIITKKTLEAFQNHNPNLYDDIMIMANKENLVEII